MAKRPAALLLQIVTVLLAIGALAFLLGEPHLEGRNANATLFEIYFRDPFLAFVYVASVPFFIGLRQAFTALGYVRQGRTISTETARALRTIKRCALALASFVAVSFCFLTAGSDHDDRPAGIALRLFVLLPSAAAAAAAAKAERLIREAV